MEKSKSPETEEETLRLLLGRGVGFSSQGLEYRLQAQPLGGEVLLRGEIRQLEMEVTGSGGNPVCELLTLWENQRDKVIRIIARATCRTREEHLSENFINDRGRELSEILDAESGPLLLAAILKDRRSDRLQELTGLREEQEMQRRIAALREEESGMIGFGGRSVFGRLIDRACSRYGWSYDQTVWGVSLGALEMMLADQFSSIYVSEEERRKLGIKGAGEIDGDNASIEELREFTE
ncbi:MAG: hypothetical protein K2M69_00565 [Muribaculaceae bacterium]|nr:hypothetical protein [Muribaculaceae bacterium]